MQSRTFRRSDPNWKYSRITKSFGMHCQSPIITSFSNIKLSSSFFKNNSIFHFSPFSLYIIISSPSITLKYIFKHHTKRHYPHTYYVYLETRAGILLNNYFPSSKQAYSLISITTYVWYWFKFEAVLLFPSNMKIEMTMVGDVFSDFNFK